MRIFITFLSLAVAQMAFASDIKTQVIEYKDGDTVLEGFLAWDAKLAAKRPGIVIVHDWLGVGPFVKERAERLAKMGYIAFAADVYGKGVRPKDPKKAGETAGKFKADRELLRRRMQVALEELRKQPAVDTGKVAAMGFCFGGTSALELARAGADIKGVVSFHGGLDTPNPGDAKNIKARVLALHGADDPYVPPAQVRDFEEEMKRAGVKYELVKYPKAVHSFTNPEAGHDNSKGAAYNAKADRKSWEAMKKFLNEIFGKKA